MQRGSDQSNYNYCPGVVHRPIFRGAIEQQDLGPREERGRVEGSSGAKIQKCHQRRRYRKELRFMEKLMFQKKYR